MVATQPKGVACAAKWWIGKEFEPYLNDGHPFLVEVIGRAERPGYRYLVKAMGHDIDSKCVDTFLVDTANLTLLKNNWKQEQRIIARHPSERSVSNEVASVHRIP